MITIKVYGALRKLIKKKTLEVSNCHRLSNVLNFLVTNFPQVRQLINNSSEDYLAFILNGTNVDSKSLRNTWIFDGDTLKVVGVYKGAGKNAYTIIGVILIVVGYILYEFGGEALVQAGLVLMSMGVAMVVSGLTMAVIAPANYDNSLKDPALKSSYGFGNSADNLSKQGNPVPIGYGTMRVGSQVIGAGLSAANI